MPASIADTSLALTGVAENEFVRQKMEMDSLRKRLGDSTSEKEKLRESCEGFESIFIQKMWEQMRKNVSKEGYLHSKDEETYQSMFDVELAKKMTSAGGIGLADMLYEQLSQKLENTGRTTSPSSYRSPLAMNAAAAPRPQAEAAPPAAVPMSADDLYSDLDAGPEAKDEPDVVAIALAELKDEVSRRGAVAEFFKSPAIEKYDVWTRMINGEDVFKNDESDAGSEENPLRAAGPSGDDADEEGRKESASAMFSAESALGGAAPDAAEVEKSNRAAMNTSWHANNNISIEPRPIPKSPDSGRSGKVDEADKSSGTRSISPEGTVWPVDGRLVSRFGWEDDAASGRRRWNSGVAIEADPGQGVVACLDGKVSFAGEREGYGRLVILEHADGYRSYYGNVQADNLKEGDAIQAGTVFAKVLPSPAASGQAANSAQGLLKFELKRGEMALNPEHAIKSRV